MVMAHLPFNIRMAHRLSLQTLQARKVFQECRVLQEQTAWMGRMVLELQIPLIMAMAPILCCLLTAPLSPLLT